MLSLKYVPRSVRRAGRRALEMVGLRERPLLAPSDGFHTLTPETPNAIREALRQVQRESIGGDYCEFGLFEGYTFCYAQKAAARLGLGQMRFFGFDSFKGLPAPTAMDGDTPEFQAGDYACSIDHVRRNLTNHGVDWSRTQLIEGYYEDSLHGGLATRLFLRSVAVALIDCDLYQSTVPVLRFLSPLLQDGTVLLFDDWNCFQASDKHGERRAFDEFLREHPQWRAQPWISFGWHGQAFILRHSQVGAQCIGMSVHSSV